MNGRELAILAASVASAALLVGGAVVWRGLERNPTKPSAVPQPEAQPTARASALAPPDEAPAAPTTPTGQRTAERGLLDGATTAGQDLASGKLGWRAQTSYGYPAPVGWETVSMTDVLRSDFHIDVRWTGGDQHGGCVGGGGGYEPSLAQSYNALMRPAIFARHGADVFDIARQRAAARTRENERAYESAVARCKADSGTACDELDPVTQIKLGRGRHGTPF